jgi:hypothetical protein
MSVPEPWAVALDVSTLDTFPNDDTDAVTCQFHRRDTQSGVRINTPFALQTDRLFYLETPLDYSRYESIGEHGPALFTLEHSFCGAALVTKSKNPDTLPWHTSGVGSLKILGYSPDAGQTKMRDHRVYSSTKLALTSPPPPDPPPTNIRALGVTLGSVGGAGQMSVRLRSFSIWLPA